MNKHAKGLKKDFFEEYIQWGNVMEKLGLASSTCRYYVDMEPRVDRKEPFGKGKGTFYSLLDVMLLKNWLQSTPITIERGKNGQFKRNGRKKR